MTVTDTPTRPAVDWELRQDLENALAFLDRQGWCKGADQDSDGRVCLNGAIWLSRKGVSRQAAMWRAVKAHLPKGVEGGIAYNDHPNTSLADIRALFVKAIESA